MGGHGGLNILPQKRWNVYRQDNRAKVARDEAEDLRRKDEKERQRRALQLDAKIGRLRARAVESGHECVKDEKPKLIKNEDLDGQDGQALELPEVFGSEKKKRRKSVGDGKFRDDRCGTGHINLFNDEEIQFKKAETAHAKYLAEVGHESTDISDFDRIISQTSTPWYLQSRDEHRADISSDHSIVQNDQQKNAFKFKAGSIEVREHSTIRDDKKRHRRKNESKQDREIRKRKEREAHMAKLRNERIAREEAAMRMGSISRI